VRDAGARDRRGQRSAAPLDDPRRERAGARDRDLLAEQCTHRVLEWIPRARHANARDRDARAQPGVATQVGGDRDGVRVEVEDARDTRRDARGFAQVVDPDMLDLGDDATVHALFQAHTFEDRVLKIGPVRVRARATVGSGAVLFYGTDVGEDARVAPHGVVMKGERLLPGRSYAGSPSRPV